jgi:hypothetical protein
MNKPFIDKKKINFEKTFSKLYVNKSGVELNTIPSTPSRIITIKERNTSKVIGDNRNVDPDKFRNGVEILNDMHKMRGVVDISCGFEGHIHENLIIGQKFVSEEDNYFNDNKQQYESIIQNLISPGDNAEGKVLSFYRLHFSGSDGYGLNKNIRETTKNLYDEVINKNGVIKIFNNESMFSTNVFENDASPNKNIGNRITEQAVIQNQKQDNETFLVPFFEIMPNTLIISKSIKASTQKKLDDYVERKIGKIVLLNGNKEIGIISSNASVRTINNKIIQPNTLKIAAEENDYFDETASKHKTIKVNDNMDDELKEILLSMANYSTDNYVGDSSKSASTGFIFDDAPFGVDSIAFR